MSDLEETIWDPMSSLGREWPRAPFLSGVFLANEEELTGNTFTTSPNTANPNTYVKFIFLRTSQDPLKAILVNFGRRALNFFVWKLLEKNEKWHLFCAHAQWWSPWRRKMSKKGTSLRRI